MSYKSILLAAALGAATLGVAACAETPANDAKQETTQAPAKAHHKASKSKPAAPSMTRAQANAMQAARSYLDLQGFSRKGLVKQLSSSAGDGYARADAEYAVDHLDIDWNAQAVRSAKQYLDMQAFSRSALIEQLSSSAGDGYTRAQAQHAADTVY